MGLTVLGASGRVDIRGQRDVITLLREDKNGQDTWVAVLRRVPELETKPFDSETLKYALERVMLPLT